jgi:hypothetical protein
MKRKGQARKRSYLGLNGGMLVLDGARPEMRLLGGEDATSLFLSKTDRRRGRRRDERMRWSGMRLCETLSILDKPMREERDRSFAEIGRIDKRGRKLRKIHGNLVRLNFTRKLQIRESINL